MLIVNKAIAQPWECDVLGHLTTRFYVAMFDDASYHFLYEVFGFKGNRDDTETYGWADVHHEIDYLAEVSAGDLLEIRAFLVKIGSKSITARYEMRNLNKEELAARLESVSVLFDLEHRKAATIPEDLRERAAHHVRPDDAGPR